MKIMVDTCYWVEFFRSNKNKASSFVSELLRNDNSWTSGIIISELVYGSLSQKEADLIKNLLLGAHLIPIDDSTIMKAGEMGFSLRRKGFTVPLTDLIIAVQCLEHDLEILSTDKHFNVLAEHYPVKIYHL